MKKIVLLTLFCVFMIPNVSAQETNYEEGLSGQEAVDYFTHRYKKKRGTARGFLFGGLGAVAIGAIVADNADNGGLYSGVIQAGGGGILMVVGTISSLVSIPFYIKAGTFKRQAYEARQSLNISLGTIRSPERNDFAVGLTYNF